MAFCTACGTKLPEGAVFCTNCGTRVLGTPADNYNVSPDDDSSAANSPTQSENETPPQGFYTQHTDNENTAPPTAPPPSSLGYPPAGRNPGSVPKDNSKTAVIIIAAVTVLLLVLVAVVIWGISAGRNSDNLPPQDPASSAPVSNPNLVSGSGTVGNGDFSISIIGAEQTRDVDDKPTIRVYFNFTNYYDYAISAYSALTCEAHQDGKLLTEAYLWVLEDDYDPYYNLNLLVRPGASLFCSWDMNYNPDGGPVELMFYDSYEGVSGGSVKASYEPSSLPGKPGYTAKNFDNPQWTLDVPEAGTLDDAYYVKVTTAELITDFEGRAAIRTYYEFTNNSTDTTSLYYALYCLAYQDGVQLTSTEVASPTASDEAFFAELQPGQSITASCVFLLRNESSPVEAEIEATYSYDAVGQTYEIK